MLPPFDQFITEAKRLYEQEDYAACIKLFNKLFFRYEKDEKSQTRLNIAQAMKLSCYFKLHQHDQLQIELSALFDKPTLDYNAVASLTEGLVKYTLDHLIATLPPHSRYVSGQHLRLAFVRRDFESIPALCKQFESFSPDAIEHTLQLSYADNPLVHFDSNNIHCFRTNDNLPNRLTCFELGVTNGYVSLSGTIPLPINDFVSNIGSLKLETAGVIQRFNIKSTQVHEMPHLGPYALRVKTPQLDIQIFNTHLAGKLEKSRFH